MIGSLNAMFPALGRILDETPDALRTRQRALVAAGLLDSLPGKGPGSGVAATPRALAQFLIGACTDTGNGALLKARPSEGRCPFTGTKTFVDALAAILADEALARRVQEVHIAISYGYATIRYDGAPWQDGPEALAKRPPKSVVFGGAPRRSGLQFSASIPAEILLAIVKELKQ